MAGVIDIIAEKLGIRGQDGGSGGGDKSQFILAGALVLVIIIAITIIFLSITDGTSASRGPKEVKYYDIETKEVVTLDPRKIDPDPDAMMSMGPGINRLVNPKTGKRTLVPMIKCPACGEWFVPEAYLEEDGMMMSDAKFICDKCGTDIHQWHREHRRRHK